MNYAKLNEWLNLVAALSVLAGLFFVGLELRQNNVLAQAETVRDLWWENNEIARFELENEILPLLRKSVEQPLELTDDEIDRLDTYLQMFMQFHIAVAVMRSNYDLALGTIESHAADIVDDVLGGSFARGWFAASAYWIRDFHPELVSAIEAELSRVPVKTEHTWPAEIRTSVEEVLDNDR